MENLALVSKYAPVLSFHPKEGEYCCFPSDASDAYERILSGSPRLLREPAVLDEPPCFYQLSQKQPAIKRLKFWIWYNYNDYPFTDAIPGFDQWVDHLGDWESFELLFKNDVPEVAFFSNHQSARRVAWRDVIKTTSGNPCAWVALGSHAFFEKPNVIPFFPPDHVADGGAELETKNNLVDVTTTKFYQDHFLGDWGEGRKIFGPPARDTEENGY